MVLKNNIISELLVDEFLDDFGIEGYNIYANNYFKFYTTSM